MRGKKDSQIVIVAGAGGAECLMVHRCILPSQCSSNRAQGGLSIFDRRHSQGCHRQRHGPARDLVRPPHQRGPRHRKEDVSGHIKQSKPPTRISPSSLCAPDSKRSVKTAVPVRRSAFDVPLVLPQPKLPSVQTIRDLVASYARKPPTSLLQFLSEREVLDPPAAQWGRVEDVPSEQSFQPVFEMASFEMDGPSDDDASDVDVVSNGGAMQGLEDFESREVFAEGQDDKSFHFDGPPRVVVRTYFKQRNPPPSIPVPVSRIEFRSPSPAVRLPAMFVGRSRLVPERGAKVRADDFIRSADHAVKRSVRAPEFCDLRRIMSFGSIGRTRGCCAMGGAAPASIWLFLT